LRIAHVGEGRMALGIRIGLTDLLALQPSGRLKGQSANREWEKHQESPPLPE
jgi:hypothetical protein